MIIQSQNQVIQRLQNQLDEIRKETKMSFDEQSQKARDKFEEELNAVKAERDEALQRCAKLEKELEKFDKDKNPLLFTIYEKFNTDYPGRLHLINQIQQWHKLGHWIDKVVDPEILDCGLLMDEKMEDPLDLKNDMCETFFPVIDIQEHNKRDRKEDL